MNASRLQLLASFLVPGVLFLTSLSIVALCINDFWKILPSSMDLSIQAITIMALPTLAIAYLAGLACYNLSYYHTKDEEQRRQAEVLQNALSQYDSREMETRLRSFGAPQHVITAVQIRDLRSRNLEYLEIGKFMNAAVLLRATSVVGDQLEYGWQLMRTLWSFKTPVACLAASLVSASYYLCYRDQYAGSLVVFGFAALCIHGVRAVQENLERRSMNQIDDIVRNFSALKLDFAPGSTEPRNTLTTP